jgi:hypothetical protein
VKKSLSWFKKLKKPEKLLIGFGAFMILVILAGSGSQKPTNLNVATASSKTKTASSQSKPKQTVTTKTETDTQSIAFASTTVNDSNLAKGTTKVTTAGVDGSQTLTYKITYENGKQTGKQLVGTQVTSQPVTQVTSVGTYVAPAPAPAPSCPNGTYVNSSGNTVCSPYASSSAPAGATAKCNDGTYSFSQHHSGTCSSHGGVAEWL